MASQADDYILTTDKSALQLDVIHGFLVSAYWCRGVPRDVVARAIEHSHCVGAYRAAGGQVGFARAVTDYATFAYLADVFVLPEHRGSGLGRRLVATLIGDRALQGLRRWLLATRDAHSLYRKFGFAPLRDPATLMQIAADNPYGALADGHGFR